MGRTGPAFPELADDAAAGMSFDEQPAHQVTLSLAFEMDAAPVTQTQWEAKGMEGLAGDASHTQALAYAAAVSNATGALHRLPTEAEWE
jgi:formylglycine-generating enzyme required for sulfatase activity